MRERISLLLRLPWLVGPIFTKELRVASRQRRQYVLRFAYLAVLTVFLVLSWLTVVRFDTGGTVAHKISRMSEVGKQVISLIIWFQCIAAQLMAVIVTSTSFSDEIRNGTLGILVSTPLTNLRIVTGKLFSHMLQILVLLGISFPLLAMVRVLGGVPWWYVIAGLGITFTACLFAGAVTMLYSMRFRRAYVTILLSVGTVFGAYAVVALVLVLTCVGYFLIPYFVPFAMLGVQTVALTNPGSGVLGFVYFWPVHCAIMSAASFGVLLLCASALRRVALKQATGESAVAPLPTVMTLPSIQYSAAASVRPPPAAAGPGFASPAPPPAQPPLPAVEPEDYGPVRRVEGSPILWREFLRPVLGEPVTRAVVIVITFVLLLLTYVLMLGAGVMDEPAAQAFFVVTYLVVGLGWTAMLGGTTIATERESRCWPILMTTTLPDTHILLAKALSVLRRSALVWALLGIHLIVFSAVGLLHLVAILHVLAISAGALAFVLGLCLYLSMRLKRTTSAVMLSVGIPVLLWALMPAVGDMLMAAGGWDPAGHGALARIHVLINPVVQAIVVTAGATCKLGLGYQLRGLQYSWPFGAAGIGVTTLAVLAVNAAYGLLGVLLALLARRRFRRDIF